MVEKKGLFFYKFIFILANETKDNIRAYNKKHFFVIFEFLDEKLILDYVINTKSQILHAIYFLS